MSKRQAKREWSVGNPTCLLGFDGRNSVDSAVFDASSIDPGGVNEVQTITVTGVPTGGTFTLRFKGQTTAALDFDATGAEVQAALRALSRIGAEGVTVTGNGPYVVTFGGKLGNQDVESITVANNSLTGGTAPNVTVAETTKGSSLFAGQLVLTSGIVLMNNADDTMVVPWDGGSPDDIVGIFDGQRELFGPEDHKEIPVYNHGCTFDKDVVKGYAANAADLETWAAGAGGCQFKSQGDE